MALEAWIIIGLPKEEREELIRLLKQSVFDSCITCGECESDIEADCPKCGICGWENPLRKHGLI